MAITTTKTYIDNSGGDIDESVYWAENNLDDFLFDPEPEPEVIEDVIELIAEDIKPKPNATRRRRNRETKVFLN